MAPIDSLLAIVIQNQGTELRLGTDKSPGMYRRGVQLRLSLPATSRAELLHLLGALHTADIDAALMAGERVETAYDAAALGAFQVTFAPRPGDTGFDVTFLRAQPRARAIPSPVRAPARSPAPSSGDVASAEGALRADDGSESGATPVDAPKAAPNNQTIRISRDSALGTLISTAFALHASDLHLSSGEPAALRVDGRIVRPFGADPVDVWEVLAPHLSEPSRARIRDCRSLDDAVELSPRERCRINVYHAATGLVVALRLLRPEVPDLDSLRFPLPLDDLVGLPNGLVIVSGATGSGKSTTLAALASEILRKRSVVLVTLEDPIEYRLEGTHASLVRQRQVGRDVPTFSAGLRDAMREDPDVILVGEMRDPESISLALTAAETGHLVLTSLHSRTATSAVERIVDAYPPERQGQIRVQLSESLRAVLAQRLVPRAAGEGRRVALEVLRATHAVSSMIREGKTPHLATAIQSGRREGMLSLDRSLADLVRQGEVTQHDALAVATDPATLGIYLRGA